MNLPKYSVIRQVCLPQKAYDLGNLLLTSYHSLHIGTYTYLDIDSTRYLLIPINKSQIDFSGTWHKTVFPAVHTICY